MYLKKQVVIVYLFTISVNNCFVKINCPGQDVKKYPWCATQ